MRTNIGLVIMLGGFLLGISVGYHFRKQEPIEITPPEIQKVKKVSDYNPGKAHRILEKIFNQPIYDLTTFSTTVTVSAYTASEDETDSTPELTADNTPSRIGILAISRDIQRELGLVLGQTVILQPYGVFKIHDVMNSRWKRRVDILHASKKAARRFGVKSGATLMWFNWDGRSLIASVNKTLY